MGTEHDGHIDALLLGHTGHDLSSGEHRILTLPLSRGTVINQFSNMYSKLHKIVLVIKIVQAVWAAVGAGGR